MLERRQFYQIYLIIALGFGGIGLLDSFLQFCVSCKGAYQTEISLISFMFVLINIIAIPYFWYNKMESFAYLLPVYHLSVYSLLTIFGIFLAMKSLVEGSTITGFIIAGMLASLFEITLTVFLMRKENLI